MLYIKEWRRVRAMTQTELADNIGRDKSAMSRIESGQTSPSQDLLARIAAVLDVTVGDLYSLPSVAETAHGPVDARIRKAQEAIAGVPPNTRPTPQPVRHAEGVDAPPPPQRMPKDLPVLGTAAGSMTGAFEMDAKPIDYVRRPPALEGARDCYAIYVVGESMEPRWREGDLVFVHPHRRPVTGDDVIIQIKTADHEPIEAYIKELLKRSGERLVCRQLNPDATIEFTRATVVAVHKILTNTDLFGV